MMLASVVMPVKRCRTSRSALSRMRPKRSPTPGAGVLAETGDLLRKPRPCYGAPMVMSLLLECLFELHHWVSVLWLGTANRYTHYCSRERKWRRVRGADAAVIAANVESPAARVVRRGIRVRDVHNCGLPLAHP